MTKEKEKQEGEKVDEKMRQLLPAYQRSVHRRAGRTASTEVHLSPSPPRRTSGAGPSHAAKECSPIACPRAADGAAATNGQTKVL